MNNLSMTDIVGTLAALCMERTGKGFHTQVSAILMVE